MSRDERGDGDTRGLEPRSHRCGDPQGSGGVSMDTDRLHVEGHLFAGRRRHRVGARLTMAPRAAWLLHPTDQARFRTANAVAPKARVRGPSAVSRAGEKPWLSAITPLTIGPMIAAMSKTLQYNATPTPLPP